ncbi:hypothetical protein Tco_0258533, partial [Tanacetum coccineum]
LCQLIPLLPILMFTLRHDLGVFHLRILTRRLPDSYYMPAEDEAPIEAYTTEVASAPPPPSFLPLLIRPPRTREAIA